MPSSRLRAHHKYTVHSRASRHNTIHTVEINTSSGKEKRIKREPQAELWALADGGPGWSTEPMGQWRREALQEQQWGLAAFCSIFLRT